MSLYQQLNKLGGAAASTSSAALAQLARAAAAAGDSQAVAVLQQQLPSKSCLGICVKTTVLLLDQWPSPVASG